MTWPHFFVAGTLLQINGMGKSEDAMVRGHHFCRKSRRIASVLHIQLANLQEVS